MTPQGVDQYVYDVAVVGMGPVGELGALLLAREGLRVLALERQADMYSRPRVGVLDGEALRTLQKAGVYDRAAADATLVTLCGPGRRPVETGASREVLEDIHEVARPFFGRRPFVVVRPDGYVYATPSR